MQHYEVRFPEIQGFRSVSVDVKQPGGLDDLIADLKTRHDWIKQEEEQYRTGPWPLGVLAHRLGTDTIDVAGGLASKGIPLKVAMGNEPERDAAAQAVRENARKGCFLDLLAFWTAWRLQALDAIAATCGPIHLTHSVMDRLRARRDRIDQSAEGGLRSARYDAGKLAIQEVAAEVVAEWRDDVDRAIAWADANASVCPLVVREDMPPELREHLRACQSDIFDCVVLAMQNGMLLVTDDLPTREFSRLVGGGSGAWLHQVIGAALNQGFIDSDTYVRWSALLVDAGHNYIGVSGQVLVHALRMDARAGDAPGYLFKTLCRVIGGRSAEPRSHINVSRECLHDLWCDNATFLYRQPATGLLLCQLVLCERRDDYGLIVQTLLQSVEHLPRLVDYIHNWVRGHFIPEALK
jgi:cellulose synthase operon protein C